MVFSIGATRDTNLTIHFDLARAYSFLTCVPANPDLIMESSLNTDTLADPDLI